MPKLERVTFVSAVVAVAFLEPLSASLGSVDLEDRAVKGEPAAVLRDSIEIGFASVQR